MATKTTLIKNAKRYLGTPYVWGGDCEQEGGLDCSGYMYNVMLDSGMKVTRNTAQGYANTVGKEIAKANMGVSDLLFFGKSKKKITHIAMYAGDNKMYESQGGSSNTKAHPGKGVVLSSVTRRSDLVMVKRICASTTAPTVAKPTLKKGGINNKEQVKLLQEDLNYVLKLNLNVDGNFGDKTKEAVKLFQTKYNVAPIKGTYGQKTYAAMVKACK